MKRVVSLFIILSLLISGESFAGAVEFIYNNDLMKTHSTAEIVSMYPEFCEYLAGQLRALNEDISVKDFKIPKDDINSIYVSVLYENPDLFYISPRTFDTTFGSDDTLLVSIRPNFLFEKSQIPAEIEKFNTAADYFLNGVDSSWSDLYKCRYVHDRIATLIEYTQDISSSPLSIYTSYGALVNNNAVCEGYTLAFNYLLKRLGIESTFVHSIEANHSWSLTKIGGKYYHIDVTLDDPTFDNLGRVNHTFFMVSDSKLKELDSEGMNRDMHVNPLAKAKASDQSYDNAWWRDVNTFIYRINNFDYYINQSYGSSVYGALTKRDQNGNTKVLEKITTRWNVYGQSEGAFWERAFSYLAYDGEYLYYNDCDEIFRTKPDSTFFEVIYKKPEALAYNIYGIAFKPDGGLYTTIKETPNTEDVLYRLESILPNNLDPSHPDATKSDYYTKTDSGIKLTHFDVYAKNLLIPNTIDSLPVTELADSLFINDHTISTVILPDTLLSIGDAAFFECENLEKVTIPKSVTNIGKNAFTGCPKLSIEGYSGSTAEAFAKEYNLHFICLDKKPEQPTTSPDSANVTPGTTTSTTQKSSTAKANNLTYYLKLKLYVGQKYNLSEVLKLSGATITCKNPKLASVTKKGIVKAKKKGKVKINVKTKKYKAVINLTIKPVRLNAKKKTLKKGQSFTVKIYGTSTVVSFRSSNKRVASVSYTGKVLAKRKGSATITVKYGKKKLKCKIKVK